MSDLISRQMALDAIMNEREFLLTNRLYGAEHILTHHAFNIIQELPSAKSERQRGTWIEYIPEHGKCPFCGNRVDLLGGEVNNFCGNCGADMRGGQDERFN